MGQRTRRIQQNAANSFANPQTTQSVGKESDVQFKDGAFTGNLTVSGTTTYINTTELDIGDNIVRLNADSTGSAPVVSSGIQVKRGDETAVNMQWSETSQEWQVTFPNGGRAKVATNNDISSIETNTSAQYTWSNNHTFDGSNVVIAAHLLTAGDVAMYSNVAVYGNTSFFRDASFVYPAMFGNSATFNANVAINASLEVSNLRTTACSAILLGYGTGIQANGSYGNTGQVLTTGINGVYWSTPAGVNLSSQYVWSNTHTFQTNVQFNDSLSAVGTISAATISGGVVGSDGLLTLRSGLSGSSKNIVLDASSGEITTTANLTANNTAVNNITISGSLYTTGGPGSEGQVLMSGGQGGGIMWSTPAGTTLSSNTTQDTNYYFPLSSNTSGAFTTGIVSQQIKFKEEGGVKAPYLEVTQANTFYRTAVGSSLVGVYGKRDFDTIFDRSFSNLIGTEGYTLSATSNTGTISYGYRNDRITGTDQQIYEQAIGQNNYSFFARARRILLAAKTTNETPVFLTEDLLAYPNGASFLTGSFDGHQFVNGEISRIKINVTAATQPTTSFAGIKTWEVVYLVYYVGNTLTVVEESRTSTDVGSTMGWDVVVEGSGQNVGVKVTGQSGTNIHWSATWEHLGAVITGAAGGK